jgi:nitroreductase
MELQDVILRRRMVRNYTAEAIDADVVRRILDNATHAPSAGFSQGWAFLVLEDEVDRDRFWRATTPSGSEDSEDSAGKIPDSWLTGMRRAPLIIVPLSSKHAYLDRYAEPDKGWTDRDESRWPMPYWHIDVGMATLLMLLTITDEGLGACFFGIPPEQLATFRAEFGVPTTYEPIGAITIGHRQKDTPSPSLKRGRRTADDVVHMGHWQPRETPS